MGETSNEQAGRPESSQGSQDDVDALLSGGGDAAAADAGPEAQVEMDSPSESADAVNQADIDALSPSGADTPEEDAAHAEPVAQGAVAQDDIDALVAGAGASGDEGNPPAADAHAEGSSQTAIDEETAANEAQVSLPNVKAFDLPDLGSDQDSGFDAERVTMLNDVQLRVKLQLGTTRMLVEDVLKLGEGSVVELDKLAGDPIDVLVNDRLVARGEVLVLNDAFCVRVSEVIARDPHRVTT